MRAEKRRGRRLTLKKYISLLLVLLLLVGTAPAAFAASVPADQPLAEKVEDTVREPTCTEAGMILKEDPVTHTVRTESIPPLGHRFGAWMADANSGLETRICELCGETEFRRPVTAEELEVARLDLSGSMDGINKKTKVTLEASFSGMGEQFHCFAVMTHQGHSTLGLIKPNYTIRFYDDPEGNEKHKLCFSDWQKEHKYILKADYYDVTQCRNLVGARLWRQITECRPRLNPHLAALPTRGAVDGFPVSVWLNGEFLGLYTMCLHKDDDLYGMEEGEHEALVICNRKTEDEASFRAPAVLDEEGVHDWEVDFCGTEDWTWLRGSFNGLISFVMNSSDEDFRAHLADYLDVDAATDYLIFLYALGLQNGGVKDLVMLNYGGTWIPSAFDMDEAFGLEPLGFAATDEPETAFLPSMEAENHSSGTGSLLWDRFLKNFEPEIATRYRILRAGVLSDESLLSLVEGFTGGIPEALYMRDAERYPGRPAADEMIQQILTYIPRRMATLDDIFGGREG